MKLTVLGCLGAYPYKKQGTTSYLLQAQGFNLLIDAGSATLVKLEEHLDPLALDAVILSHYHHDHIADLGVLQYDWQLNPNRDPKTILPIYGHGRDAIHFESLTMPNVSQGYAYDQTDELKIGPFSITFMETIHPVVCYAMRIVETTTGKVFVFTGDSGYLESFAEFAKDADLFLADTYLFEGNERHKAHFTSKESGELAKAANVKKLVLTHLPQFGDLAQLKKEAQSAAGTDIEVELATVDRVFEI
ncbi:metallo-beta-lactamase [Enterococcus sp. 10A9_DIV0425]|uniref:Metallo-beta-lactamase n=1 Tax=Candidatus Enterococcus wittei TaxID=1987383 RepID=A0A242JWB4_9ENTE|nr:MBL fold metallo-hydrolase [Enterococcus sp. 10A9_DIV0425]OTP09614.1 metallo-beta-lactamase [Enterococcus sp. 10A9_DIV0425]THE15248.1 MBL fold metallo-hydrolase [Enterococcus hirae]